MPRPRFHKLPPAQQQAILLVAFDEFATHGFTGASLNRIIEAAGVSKGSMYLLLRQQGGAVRTRRARRARSLIRVGGALPRSRSAGAGCVLVGARGLLPPPHVRVRNVAEARGARARLAPRRGESEAPAGAEGHGTSARPVVRADARRRPARARGAQGRAGDAAHRGRLRHGAGDGHLATDAGARCRKLRASPRWSAPVLRYVDEDDRGDRRVLVSAFYHS